MKVAMTQGCDYLLWCETDCRITPNEVYALRDALESGKRMVCPLYENDKRVLYCTLIRSEDFLEADEQFEWWYEMDDLEHCHRMLGIVEQIPHVKGVHPGTLFDNMPPKYIEAAQRSHDRFWEKWGFEPFVPPTSVIENYHEPPVKRKKET